MVGLVGALVLVQAVNGQMLGIGRLAYSLGTHRQIPSVLSRLDAPPLDAVRDDRAGRR